MHNPSQTDVLFLNGTYRFVLKLKKYYFKAHTFTMCSAYSHFAELKKNKKNQVLSTFLVTKSHSFTETHKKIWLLYVLND